MEANFQVIKLYDKINVYKGLLPNAKLAVELLKKSEESPESSQIFGNWQQWGTFGKHIYELGMTPESGGPELTDQTRKSFPLEDLINKEIYSAFYTATEHWLLNYSYSKENDWEMHGPSYSKYLLPNSQHLDARGGFLMSYHTDYVKLREEEPGKKFILTCTMYLNDNYDGGEIEFLINNPENASKKETVLYKPEEGDVLVFPSGHPKYFSENIKYLHAVRPISFGIKYLVRCFYVKPYAGSEAWHANLQKYGAQAWLAMEEQRVAEGRRTHNETKYIKDCSI